MFSSFGSFFDGIDGIADAFPDAKKYEGTDAGPYSGRSITESINPIRDRGVHPLAGLKELILFA